MNIINKTHQAISVPLHGGKKLHLGPGKAGQINPKEAEKPSLKKLIEAGEIEIIDDGRNTPAGDTRSVAARGRLKR